MECVQLVGKSETIRHHAASSHAAVASCKVCTWKSDLSRPLKALARGGYNKESTLTLRTVMPSPDRNNGNGHNGIGAVRPRAEGIARRKSENTDGNFSQMILQFKDVGAVFVYCAVVTFIILLAIKYTIGLRVSEEVEVEGLDINLHGEVVQA